ncbi:MAG: hypothetical protein JWR69_1891 [Pedosphaera sp.]|nr:hypothetical protein [Pedosphaera sp.]
MISFLKNLNKQGASSVLGLTLDGNRLEAVVLRRSNGTLQLQQSLTTALALSPLTGDPELVGREIRNHLDQAGIRERRCAVCIPASWVLTLHTKLPDLPDEDIGSFLQIEAERGFTSGHENLFIAESRSRFPGGEQHAMMLAIPRNHLATLEKALKAAQLKPLTFSLGVAALGGAGMDSSQGVLTLALGSNSVDLLVMAGGGIVALRSLDGAMETDGAQKRIDADLVAREIRITLGQLPATLGDGVRQVRVFGRGELARDFVEDISPRLASMGLKVELMERACAAEFDKPLPPEIALSPGLALTANRLRGIVPGPEFLPPKVHPWQQLLTTKFSSKKLAWAGAGAGAVAVCVGGAFLIQQWQISRLQSKWRSMESEVTELQTAEAQSRRFRPWFDGSFRGLRIIKRITEAFPEDGYVSAKNLEIRDLSVVTCSGVARDNQSYLKLLDQLRASKEVTELKTDQVRGQAPLQFTFNLQWEGGKPSGN